MRSSRRFFVELRLVTLNELLFPTSRQTFIAATESGNMVKTTLQIQPAVTGAIIVDRSLACRREAMVFRRGVQIWGAAVTGRDAEERRLSMTVIAIGTPSLVETRKFGCGEKPERKALRQRAHRRTLVPTSDQIGQTKVAIGMKSLKLVVIGQPMSPRRKAAITSDVYQAFANNDINFPFRRCPRATVLKH